MLDQPSKVIEYNSDQEVSIESLISSEDKFKFIRAEIDNRICELTYKVKQPCKIELFDIAKDSESQLIYKSTLMYVIAMACHNLFPNMKMLFSNDSSRSVYVRPKNHSQILTLDKFYKITEEVNRLISLDLPIVKRLVTKQEAAEIYRKLNMRDKIDTLKYRKENMVHTYTCEGYSNYLYSYMCPSTGYLKKYNFIPRLYGFMVQFPRTEKKGEIPTYAPEPMYEKTLSDMRKWSSQIGIDTIAKINRFVKDYSALDLIQLSETFHTNQLAELGKKIADSENDIRLICIAGPSSSGKTTFANRLRLELLSHGIFPIRISADDYYKEKKDMTPLADGSYDLETIDAIDTQLFNRQMLQLIEGGEVVLPRFDFHSGKRVPGRKLKLLSHQPIIVEGIHALSETLTSSIAQHNKFKIFIAPQTQINIDDTAPISLTDLRLLRRIVRDSKFRNSPAEETIDMWPSVRRGEFTWIYKTQEQADYVFNSFLPYELCVMHDYAMPLLSKIPPESTAYISARRLLQFLKYFISIDEEGIPCNSLMREFIGGSCFKDI